MALARILGTGVALAIVVRTAYRARTGVPASAVRAVALILLAVVVLSPVVHHWYLLWFVPLLATCHLAPRSSTALLHAQRAATQQSAVVPALEERVAS